MRVRDRVCVCVLVELSMSVLARSVTAGKKSANESGSLNGAFIHKRQDKRFNESSGFSFCHLLQFSSPTISTRTHTQSHTLSPRGSGHYLSPPAGEPIKIVFWTPF